MFAVLVFERPSSQLSRRMTDQQLLDLMALKAPEDLTLEEIHQMRQRMVETPALRKMLLEELQLESYFVEAFRRIDLTLPQVLAEAAQRDQKPRQPIWPAVAYVLGVMAVVYSVGFYFSSPKSPPTNSIAELSREEPSQPMPPSDEPVPMSNPADRPPETPSEEKPPAEPVPVDPLAGMPWETVMKQGGPFPSFREVSLQEFDRDKNQIRASELKQWLVNVPGMYGSIADYDKYRRRVVKFSGFLRLVSPWTTDSSLKLFIDSHNKTQFHFFRGDRGITLVYYEDQGSRWVAYKTERNPGQLRPEKWSLAASDFYRTWRTQMQYGGSFDLRFTGTECILTRGDLVLLRAPFEGLPEETYFDGSGMVYGLQIIRTQDQPPAEKLPPVVFDNNRPGELTWKRRADKGPEVEPQDDGSVRYATPIALLERVDVSTPLPREGMQEVILKVRDFSPGAGVFLGRKDGTPYEVVRFVQNPRMPQFQVVGTVSWDDKCEGEARAPKDQGTAVVDKQVWIKLIFGLGAMVWQVSVDGEHWASVNDPKDYVPGNVTSIGMQLVAQRPNVEITLERIELRELTGLTGLVPAEEIAQGLAFPTAPNLGLWVMEMASKRPAEVPWDVWKRACAAKTLKAGAMRAVACPLAELLLDDAAERQVPISQLLAALDEVGRFGIEYRDKQAFQTGLVRRYWELARTAEGNFAEVWQQWQTTPLNAQYIDYPQYEAFVRKGLFAGLYQGNAQESQRFIQRLRFFHLDEQVPLVRWGDFIARREASAKLATDGPVVIRDNWHQPLLDRVDKEAYNVTSELRAILESDALDDAAKMISRLEVGQVAGLTTAVDDRALFVSAPNSIRAAILRYPQLEQILAEKYNTLAGLRFEEAAASGNAAAMENLALQFNATHAGAAAHKWLGDRALVEGRFELAMAEYRRASEHASASLAQELEPNLRLAAAMLGQDVGEPVEQEVAFGSSRFSATEFEAMLRDLREGKQQQGANGRIYTAGEVMRSDFAPIGLRAEKRGELDGPNGDRHTEEGARHVNHYKLPWVDRQLAVAVDQEKLYVSNRFHVAAFDLKQGNSLWRSDVIPNLKTKKAQEAALITARPLILANRIIVRQLYGDGFVLTSLNKADGKLQWTLPFKEPEQLVSDPIWIYGSLVVLTGWKEGQEFIVQWSVVDLETGTIEQQREVLRLRQSWLRRPSLEFTQIDDGIVVQGAGCVFQLDSQGTPRWVRKFAWTPEEEDPRAVVQDYQKPLVAEGRLYVTQPGVRCVSCLDLATGWQKWIQVFPEMKGIIGLSRDRLIVQQEQELLAIDALDGKILWRQPLEEVHPAWLCGDDWLVSIERERLEANKEPRTNYVVWRDTSSGKILFKSRLSGFDQDDPRFGLLVQHDNHLWTFAGKTQSDAKRTLVELIPDGEAVPQLHERIPLWVRVLDAKLSLPALKHFAPFDLIHGLTGDRAGWNPSIHGENDVLGLRAGGDKPNVWLYAGKLPAKTSKLKLKVGADEGFPWKLQVTINGASVSEKEFPPTGERFVQQEVDLSKHADQHVVIVIIAAPKDVTERSLFWKQIKFE